MPRAWDSIGAQIRWIKFVLRNSFHRQNSNDELSCWYRREIDRVDVESVMQVNRMRKLKHFFLNLTNGLKIYQLSLLLNYKKWHCHAHNKQTYKQKRIKIDINNIKKKKLWRICKVHKNLLHYHKTSSFLLCIFFHLSDLLKTKLNFFRFWIFSTATSTRRGHIIVSYTVDITGLLTCGRENI